MIKERQIVDESNGVEAETNGMKANAPVGDNSLQEESQILGEGSCEKEIGVQRTALKVGGGGDAVTALASFGSGYLDGTLVSEEGSSNAVSKSLGRDLEIISRGPIFDLESVELLDQNGEKNNCYLTRSIYEVPSDVQMVEPSSEVESQEEPPKKRLKKALNDARNDSKESFE